MFPLDAYDIILPETNARKEPSNELQAQRDRLPEQRRSNGMGGKPETGARSRQLLSGASAIGRRVEGRVQESTRVRDKEAESQARLAKRGVEKAARRLRLAQRLRKVGGKRFGHCEVNQ